MNRQAAHNSKVDSITDFVLDNFFFLLYPERTYVIHKQYTKKQARKQIKININYSPDAKVEITHASGDVQSL